MNEYDKALIRGAEKCLGEDPYKDMDIQVMDRVKVNLTPLPHYNLYLYNYLPPKER